jgi:hypothetical protein
VILPGLLKVPHAAEPGLGVNRAAELNPSALWKGRRTLTARLVEWGEVRTWQKIGDGLLGQGFMGHTRRITLRRASLDLDLARKKENV